MTVRKQTKAQQIEDLKVIVTNRRHRMEGLKELIESDKCTKEDLAWIRKEIAEHEAWLKKTEAEIKRFYAPAYVA